ncbi:MAG: FAD-dependent oxidoreductase [Patescibacteria group bacterium]
MYDVIIIGAGPSGLAAAIYTSRRALKTLVLCNDVGGQVTRTLDIENYPGFDLISGYDLAKRFRDQAQKFGAEIKTESVKEIKKEGEGAFRIKTAQNEYTAKAVILAFGKKPRELGVPGEEALSGRGVTYCATCDAPFFKGKDVAVVGGGNSALDAAVLTSKIAKKVYLIHRRNEFRGEQHLIDQVNAAPNIAKILEAEVAEILGQDKVESIRLKDGRKINVDGVMVEVGFFVDRSLVQELVELDAQNQVVINPVNQQTSVPGIFAAGDLTPTPYKQIVVAAGEGAKAALAAFDYTQHLTGRRGIIADWH